MPSVLGVIETALYVADIERSARFYQDLFGWERILEDERFRALSVAGRQVLLLFERGASTQATPLPGGLIPPHDGHGTLHLAFAIAREDLEVWEKQLADKGIVLESKVTAERGGHSLYFRDPDGHLIELATPGLWSIY